MRFRTSVLALALIFAAGCSHVTAPHVADLGPAALAASWTTADAPKYGISIGVPPGWKPGSGSSLMSMMGDAFANMPTPSGPNASDLQKMNEDLMQGDAEREKKAMADLEAQGIIIRVNCTSVKPIPGEEATRYIVRIGPATSSKLEDAAQEMLQHVPGEGQPTKVQLPIGPAMELKTTKKLIDGGTVTTDKYLVLDGGTEIFVKFTTEESPQTIENIVKPVMESLRVKPGKATPPAGSGDSGKKSDISWML